MKIIYKAFTLPHVGDPYRLCADRYSVSTENDSFAISDGVGNSLFPGEWAKLICDDYVHNTAEFIVNEKLHREGKLISEWSLKRDEIVEGFSEDEKFIYEMGLDKADFAAATFVGLRLSSSEWSCQALGDSYLVLLDNEYNILQKVASMDGQPFGIYPEYFASKVGENNGTPIMQKGDYTQVKYILLMTDAVSDWFIDETRTPDERKRMIDVSSHEEFITLVDNLRQSGAMKDDDSTIVILMLENNEDLTISYECLTLDDINQLIAEDKSEEDPAVSVDVKNVDESLQTKEDTIEDSQVSLGKNDAEQTPSSGDSFDQVGLTPEETIEMQAKHILRLEEACHSYCAEVDRLRNVNLNLSEENIALKEQLIKISETLINNDAADEPKNILQRLLSFLN